MKALGEIKLKHIIWGLVIIFLCATIEIPKDVDGYDLSHHNQNLNWEKLSEAQFVYLKATQGVSFVDPLYNQYLKKARRHHLLVGAYHFMDPKLSGTKQFQHFKSVVGKDTDLIPVLDVEVLGISDSEITAFINACETYYGVKPMVYANIYDYAKHYSAFRGCKWWLSHKIPILVPFGGYHIRQYAIKEVDNVELDHNCINSKYTIKDFLLK